MSEPFTSDLSRRHFLATSATLLASTTMSHATESSANDIPLAPPDKQPPHVVVPEPPKKKIGWAIVGLGQLALEEVMPAFAQCKLSKPVALVSGHRDKAEKVAGVYGVDPKKIYDYKSYERIADDSAIEVVYIILPNSMHAEYTIRASKAGKHVLCEKPMASSVAECHQMIAAAKTANRKLMIAYRLRYEPFNMTAIDLCRKREFGQLKLISASHGQNVKAPNIRLSKTLRGGPLGDVGIYCLNAFRYLSGEEPTEVFAVAHQPHDDPRFREVPESVTFTLRFPSGLIATGDCSFGTAESRRFRVLGTTGLLDLESAFGYRGQRLFLQKESQNGELKLTPVNHFAAEMDHFSNCLLTNSAPRTPGEEGLADMRIIAACEESAQSSRPIPIKQ